MQDLQSLQDPKAPCLPSPDRENADSRASLSNSSSWNGIWSSLMVRSSAVWCLAVLLTAVSSARAQIEAPLPPALPPVNPTELGSPSAEDIPPDQGNGPSETDAAVAQPDKLAALDQKLDALSKNLTVITADPSIKIVLGGAIIA